MWGALREDLGPALWETLRLIGRTRGLSQDSGPAPVGDPQTHREDMGGLREDSDPAPVGDTQTHREDMGGLRGTRIQPQDTAMF